MPVSFLIFGLIIIAICFFYRPNNIAKFVLTISLGLILMGFFTKKLYFTNFSLNVFALIGLLILSLFGLLKNSKRSNYKLLSYTLVVAGVNFVVISFNAYLLLDFNFLPALLSVGVGMLFFVSNLHLGISFIGISMCVLEVLNCAVANKNLLFYSCFGDNFYTAFALCFALFLILNLLYKVAKFRQKQSQYVVLCKRGVKNEKSL